ncbi:DUF6233 domain-containing protein [Streptomyces uncialis]|uniref:DUF6233 domain-containing protein n=1 Tax=Streptomyces uncialis TaxID=1048205 RepID=UPI0038109E20
MSDLPPDLPQLYTLRIWHAHILKKVEARIGELERQAAERQEQTAQSRPRPDWLIEKGLSPRSPGIVHASDCHIVGGRSRPASRDEAWRARVDGAEGCEHCQVDSVLNFFDGA